MWYKLHLILEFTLVFLFILYVGNFYTSLKLWLKPPLELRVEVTAVTKDDTAVILKGIAELEGQELVVYTDGVVAYIPLVSTHRALLRYPGGSVSKWKGFAELAREPISKVIDPVDEELYRNWLKVYRRQGEAVAF
tara:strand:- start:2451 stop:2858 length:408 start_codon:yes stop_codon:yes gene_type:complete